MNSIIKYILLSCSLWATALLFSQTPINLIQNPSFEEYNPLWLCGNGANMAFHHHGSVVYGWSTSTDGSTDFYGTCSPTPMFAIPQNWKGYQNMLDGDHYIGSYFVFNKTDYWRFFEETFQGSLKEPLKPHQGYCFSFYYAIGDNEYNNCTVDTLRFYFANTDTFFRSQVTDTTHFSGITGYWVSNSTDLYGKHQIEIPIGHITDTANWHFMESHFKAKGGEKFMIGGVFKDDSFVKYKESHIDSFEGSGNNIIYTDSTAYLYFDMFSLYECDEYGLGDHKIRLPNVFTPNGDGINDTYFIHDYLPPGFEFKVYNRWGSLVYQNDNYQNEWSPKDISDGTYWVIAKNPDSGTLFKQIVTIFSN